MLLCVRAVPNKHKANDIVELVQENFDRKITQGSISKSLDRARSGRPKVQLEKQELNMIRAVEQDRTLNATKVSKDPILNPCGLTARSITTTLNAYGLFDSTAIAEEISQDAKKECLVFALNSFEKSEIGHFAFLAMKAISFLIRWENSITADKKGKGPS